MGLGTGVHGGMSPAPSVAGSPGAMGGGFSGFPGLGTLGMGGGPGLADMLQALGYWTPNVGPNYQGVTKMPQLSQAQRTAIQDEFFSRLARSAQMPGPTGAGVPVNIPGGTSLPPGMGPMTGGGAPLPPNAPPGPRNIPIPPVTPVPVGASPLFAGLGNMLGANNPMMLARRR